MMEFTKFFSRQFLLGAFLLLLFTTACNLPAQPGTPMGTILPPGGARPLATSTFSIEPPTALIPVTGNDVVSLQCQFCVNNETHALLIMPERASFLVADPVIGINCLTAKVYNGQRVVLCRSSSPTSFTLNVCVENANCLQFPIALQPCPISPQTGGGTAVATFSAPTAVVITPLATELQPTAPIPVSTATSPPMQTLSAPPLASATSAFHPQPTKAILITPQATSQQPGTVTSIQDPAEFIRWYFGQVWQVRDYQNLWDNYLTQSFKTYVSSGSFEEYTAWWSSIERVDVNSVNVLQNNGTNAWVRVNITFTMKDGRVISNQEYDYALLYDATRQTWMFNYSP